MADYPTSEEALAGALDWAINDLPAGSEIESINFGQRHTHEAGYYWYAVTYQRWQNGDLDGRLPAADGALATAERTERIRKVSARWAAEMWAGVRDA